MKPAVTQHTIGRIPSHRNIANAYATASTPNPAPPHTREDAYHAVERYVKSRIEREYRSLSLELVKKAAVATDNDLAMRYYELSGILLALAYTQNAQSTDNTRYTP